MDRIFIAFFSLKIFIVRLGPVTRRPHFSAVSPFFFFLFVVLVSESGVSSLTNFVFSYFSFRPTGARSQNGGTGIHHRSQRSAGRSLSISRIFFFCDPQTHTPSIIISSMKTAGRSAIRHRRSALMKRPPAAVPSKPPDPSHGPKRVTATTRITPKKKTKKNRRKTIKVKVECNQIPIVPAKRKKKEKKNESNQIKVAVPSRGQRFRAISYRGIKKKTNPVGG